MHCPTPPIPTATPVDVRTLLHEHRFSRAAGASAAAIDRIEERIGAMIPTLRGLPDAEPEPTVAWINTQLAGIHITPSLTAHDGADLHIHWTPSSATFDDQAIADFLMALAQELCDHGTSRFGTCAASRLRAPLLRRHPQRIPPLLRRPALRQPHPHRRAPITPPSDLIAPRV